MNKIHTQGTSESLRIRIDFRDYFGIDITEAEAILRERREETARAWHQMLVSNRVI